MSLQVLWPMVDDHEFVLRIVCDRARIMNSRERTPILLFVETVQGHDALRFNPAGVEGKLNSAASFESGSDKCAWFDACLEKQSIGCGAHQAARETQVEGFKASGSHVADNAGTDSTGEECCDAASEKSGAECHKNSDCSHAHCRKFWHCSASQCMQVAATQVKYPWCPRSVFLQGNHSAAHYIPNKIVS